MCHCLLDIPLVLEILWNKWVTNRVLLRLFIVESFPLNEWSLCKHSKCLLRCNVYQPITVSCHHNLQQRRMKTWRESFHDQSPKWDLTLGWQGAGATPNSLPSHVVAAAAQQFHRHTATICIHHRIRDDEHTLLHPSPYKLHNLQQSSQSFGKVSWPTVRT